MYKDYREQSYQGRIFIINLLPKIKNPKIIKTLRLRFNLGLYSNFLAKICFSLSDKLTVKHNKKTEKQGDFAKRLISLQFRNFSVSSKKK